MVGFPDIPIGLALPCPSSAPGLAWVNDSNDPRSDGIFSAKIKVLGINSALDFSKITIIKLSGTNIYTAKKTTGFDENI